MRYQIVDGLRTRSCGPFAIIVDCNPDHAVSIAQALRATSDFVEVIPAESSVFVSSSSRIDVDKVLQISHANARSVDLQSSRIVEIPVRYDGEDLDEVASLTGLSVQEIIQIHTSTKFTAAFAGFAPGFMYCTGLPEKLRLPRRKNPRVSVPSGAVAIADIYSAVYPLSSPGGWHLLGRTDVAMFDLDRDPVALIQPGDMVQFRAVTP